MSGRFVRQSKYRHVRGVPNKPEHTVGALRVETKGDGNFIAANSKFFAVPYQGGGGPVAVIKHTQYGRVPTVVPVVNHHTDTVLDLDWHPFNDSLLATASADTSICIYGIPEDGLQESINDSLVKLTDHQKNVGLVRFNPTANNILASTSHDLTVRIWDIEAQSQTSCIDSFPEMNHSLEWSYDGRLVGTCGKDHITRIFDPRTNEMVSGMTHEGSKPSRICFLGETKRVATVGFTKQSDRQLIIWDERKLDAPLSTIAIDQGSGVIMPFFDADSSVLFLAGKGDGQIRYYEIVDEDPIAHYLECHRTTVPQRGMCMVPKQSVDVMQCEITRLLKLERDRVEPIMMQVPRKSEAFQEDLFPDSRMGEPGTTAAEWLGGSNKQPPKRSMKPGAAGSFGTSTQTFTPMKTAKELEKELSAAQDTIEQQSKRIKELEEQLAKMRG